MNRAIRTGCKTLQIMKLFTILLFLCFHLNSFSQKFDVAPFLEECDSWDLKEAIECTQSTIANYFLDNIDEDLCPESGDTYKYLISYNVSAEGEIQNSKITSVPTRSNPCFEYIKDRAEDLTDILSFESAILNDENISFKTTVVIEYPNHRNQNSSTSALFNGCGDSVGNNYDTENCGKTELVKFIYTNLKYPRLAKQKKIEGMAVIGFTVNKTGQMEDLEVIRDIGGGCGQEALRIVKILASLDQPYMPATKNGEAVSASHNIPIRFRLK